MGWGFRKSIKIAPGVRINLSKKGVSASLGTKGLTYNTRGRVTASIPGSGIRYTQNLNSRKSSGRQDPRLKGSTSIDPDGIVRLSKREQATRDFVDRLQSRLGAQKFLGTYLDTWSSEPPRLENQFVRPISCTSRQDRTPAMRFQPDTGNKYVTFRQGSRA